MKRKKMSKAKQLGLMCLNFNRVELHMRPSLKTLDFGLRDCEEEIVVEVELEPGEALAIADYLRRWANCKIEE